MSPLPDRRPVGGLARRPTPALASPVAVAGAGGLVLVGLLADAPLVAVVVLALVGYLVGVAASLGLAALRRPRPPRIDPFTLGEPWRNHVRHALQAQARYRQAVAGLPEGPLAERLGDIGRRLDEGVLEAWRIARHGHALDDARQLLGPPSRRAAAGELEEGEPIAEALGAQRASADRLRQVSEDAAGRLRLLEARLDEAVARAVELTLQAGGEQGAHELGRDVESVVLELEALRLAVEEVDAGTRPPELG